MKVCFTSQKLRYMSVNSEGRSFKQKSILAPTLYLPTKTQDWLLERHREDAYLLLDVPPLAGPALE